LQQANTEEKEETYCEKLVALGKMPALLSGQQWKGAWPSRPPLHAGKMPALLLGPITNIPRFHHSKLNLRLVQNIPKRV
jgi:hypothetical protein